MTFIALPLALLGVLFHVGRPEPRRWAWRALLVLPPLTALVSGAWPGYRAITRFDDGNYNARLVEGAAVRLVWAPEGPGWGTRHASWEEAMHRCAHLTADGRALDSAPVGIWRLPTVDEAVRSMVRRGRNAGGKWDAAKRKASYRVMPEKESPLWQRYSPVIYWWTAPRAPSASAITATSFRSASADGAITGPTAACASRNRYRNADERR